MKILLNQKLTIVFVDTLLCFASVKAQTPDNLKDLPAFKLRASILSLLHKPNVRGFLNEMQCSSNAPCIKAQNTLGGSGDDFTDKLIPILDGGFIVCGGTNSADGDFNVPEAKGNNAYLAKYDKLRHLEWTKALVAREMIL